LGKSEAKEAIEADAESLTESEELDIIGEDLVRRKLRVKIWGQCYEYLLYYFRHF
jgi:hypothetical protein